MDLGIYGSRRDKVRKMMLERVCYMPCWQLNSVTEEDSVKVLGYWNRTQDALNVKSILYQVRYGRLVLPQKDRKPNGIRLSNNAIGT